ncbi:MAG: penicillin-binding protein 2 [Nitrospirae bacterium]|nr:penicillin-binding protein 2 [Nitrospirota bacterium]
MWYHNSVHGGGEGTADIKRRLWIIVAFVVVSFSALVLRLWYLQVVRGKYYRELSESNRIREVDIRPPRGILYDRNGVIIAANTPSYSVIFTPEDAKDSPGTVEKLGAILGMTTGDIEARIKSERNRNPYKPIRVKENASFEEVSEVEARKDDLPGVIVQVELRRYYPYGEFASHLLGYIGKVTPEQLEKEEYKGLPPDFLIGQYGIERTFDRYIRGEPGKRGVEVDAMGRQVRVIYNTEPAAGQDMVLTLDYKAQKAAEDAMGDQPGAIVAIEPRTGEVLAMTSRPGFDPNIFPLGLTPAEWAYLTQDEGKPLNNRALQGQFPPGSTFKLAMALAGLETGKFASVNGVFCSGGWFFGNRVFHCWKREGHGTVALHKAVVESCDIYFYKLGDLMGIDNIHKYSTYLGLGKQTGVGIREKDGLIPSTEWKQRVRHDKWYPGETLSCAIGQGYISTTPIQLARMVATIANGGTLYQPSVVREIRGRDGKPVASFPPVVLGEAPVKREHLQFIMDAMKGVVEEPGGTAHSAKSEHVTVGGKTGTAQVIGLGKGRGKKYQDHAWFVAVAPVEDPKIAVCVLVEHGGHGGSTSAPLAKKVIEAYLRVDEESLREKAALENITTAGGRPVLKNITGSRWKAALRNMTGIRWKSIMDEAAARKKRAAMKNVTSAAKRARMNNLSSTAKRPSLMNRTSAAKKAAMKNMTGVKARKR